MWSSRHPLLTGLTQPNAKNTNPDPKSSTQKSSPSHTFFRKTAESVKGGLSCSLSGGIDYVQRYGD